MKNQEPIKATRFLDRLVDRLRESGIPVPQVVSTPYVNTIPAGKAAGLSRRLADGSSHQKFHPLERHGDGGQRECNS